MEEKETKRARAKTVPLSWQVGGLMSTEELAERVFGDSEVVVKTTRTMDDMHRVAMPKVIRQIAGWPADDEYEELVLTADSKSNTVFLNIRNKFNTEKEHSLETLVRKINIARFVDNDEDTVGVLRNIIEQAAGKVEKYDNVGIVKGGNMSYFVTGIYPNEDSVMELRLPVSVVNYVEKTGLVIYNVEMLAAMLNIPQRMFYSTKLGEPGTTPHLAVELNEATFYAEQGEKTLAQKVLDKFPSKLLAMNFCEDETLTALRLGSTCLGLHVSGRIDDYAIAILDAIPFSIQAKAQKSACTTDRALECLLYIIEN